MFSSNAVAPASVDFSSAGDGSSIRAFRLEVLEPLVLHRGTWHWGPFPVTADEVTLYNVQGLGYADDNESCDLTAIGKTVRVFPQA